MQARRTESESTDRSLIDTATEALYRAGMGDVSWTEALEALVRAHGAESAMLFTPEVPAELGGLSVSLDLAARAALRAVPTVKPIVRSKTSHAFSTVLDTEGDEQLPSTLFLLFRAESAPALAKADVEAIQASCRHVAMAVRLWYRDRFSRHGSEALASNLNAAALIADEGGRVSWMNLRAETWVRERRILLTEGRVADVPGASIDISRAVREASQCGGRVLAAANASITVEIVPIPAPRSREATGPVGCVALMIFRDRAGCKEVAAALAANFRLTATEIDLAMALWKGILIAEYAAQRSVAMSTVRTQLKSLLSKTHARRQSDIVSLVARMMPLAAPPPNG